jgi:glucuronoarabinoxylan endo-1,4-beta-xylanase
MNIKRNHYNSQYVCPTSLALLLLFLITACSDSGGGSDLETLSGRLSFSPGFIEVADNDLSATVSLKWSSTSWRISLGTGEVVNSVSPMSGGDGGRSGATDITISLNVNTENESRAQDIIVTDDAGEVCRFVVRQSCFSQWNVVSVDPSVRYQRVVGFGGMYNPYIWTPSNLVTNAEIDKLYSSDGLGYNILRLMIYSDKSAWTRDVSGAQRAAKHGATIFACPWDCNAAWADSVTVNGSLRKHLRPEHYADYADHLCNFVTYMKGRGVTIYGITVQNEPNGSFVYWSPTELAAFIAEYGAKIRATGVKLMSPEPEGVSANYIDPVVGDAAAMANIDIVATHTYTGFIDDKDDGTTKRNYLANLFLARLQPDGKSWWMTEHLFNDGSSASFPSERLFQQWDYNLSHLAKEIHLCMESYCSAYVYWYLKRYYGLIGDNDELSPVGNGEVTKNGYIVSHYAAYAAGSVRLSAVSPLAQLDATAYWKDTKESAVILTNNGDTSLCVRVAGMGVSRAVAVTTTADLNMAELAARVENGDVCITLPALSITSVRCYTY